VSRRSGNTLPTRSGSNDLPFLLFTGKGSEEVASDAITAGATDYLQKGSGTEQYELLANRVVNAVDQYRSKRRAADLERVRTLASDVNQALVRASSRKEIESRVCEIITGAEPYRFAVCAQVDPETKQIEPRTWAGIGDGFLDEFDMNVREDADGYRAPGGRAFHEREIAISQNLQNDPRYERWRELALEHGFHAIAVVPLEHDDTLYGLLALLTDRPDAFDDTEQDLLVELGDDIAHALHAQEVNNELRRSKERFQALFENAPGPVITGDVTDGGDRQLIRDVNDAFEDVFGFDAEEIIGRDVAEVVVPDEGMDRHAEFREKAAAGETVEAEVQRQTVDGPRTFLLHVIPFGVNTGQAEGWYAWYMDITERKHHEDRVAHQQSLLEAVMETSIDGILVIDEDREYVTWNQQFIDMWGVPEELVGDKPEELGLEWALDRLEDPDAFIEKVEYLYEHPGEESRDQIRLTDGRVFDRYSAPVEGDDGTYFGRVWFFRDITERETREQILEQLHAATRDLMTATTIEEVATIGSETADKVLDLPMNGLHLYDPDEDALVPVAWSEECESIFGGTPPSIPAGEGLAWQAYSAGEPEIYADVRKAAHPLNEATPFRSELHLPLGEHGVLLAASTEADDFDATDEALGRVLAANVEAALDRVERERDLAEERDKYETLVDQSHDAIAIHQNGEFVFANPRCLEILGYNEDELIGKPFKEITAPEDRDLVRDRYEQRLDPEAESPPAQYEARFLTKDGNQRVGEISAARIQYEGDSADLVMIRDVTERRGYEERLEETTEELEALNRVVRHDIRNDMSIILGWAQMLDDHVDETGQAYLQKILASGEHIVELTEIARDYVEALTSEDTVEVTPTPLRSILETEIDLRRESFPEAEFVVTGEIPDVEVMANEMLGSVFRNLLNNAVQHNTNDEPVVDITCEVDDDDVVVRVADNGSGIPDDRKESIFGKGEKDLGSPGTGIGLYLVQTLVNQYDGSVWVEDNEPDGAVFTVRLVRAE
ncbi:MAG: PAS domain S-box protein, partial [Halobacteriales archaeon]